MRRQPVTSSAIDSVGYDPDVAVLELEFTSGDIYRYYAVPNAVHAHLMVAPSPGRYFLEHIRDTYPSEQIRE